MLTLIAGLILLAVPFLFVVFFPDKKAGFIYILFFSLLFQTILAFSTQALGVFYYYVALGCTFLADVVLILVFLKIKNKKDKKYFHFSFSAIDWTIIIIAVISISSLYQIHYNYTGEISSATDQTISYHQVRNMVYPYPYFSDEWYAVSLIEGAINNHSLPVKNILSNTFFLNMELFFHSFVAQMMLILGLNPLFNYTVLSIFFNALIIILVYLFLRLSKLSKLASAFSSLSVLYITCGANLPGLWHFIPFNSGLIFFLISICFMAQGDVKMSFLSTIISSLFYPPLIPFYWLGLLVFLLCRFKKTNKKLFNATIYGFLSLFVILPAAHFLLIVSPLAGIAKYVVSRIFFISLVSPFILQINFYNIIPPMALILAVLGLYNICKNKKWILLAELVLGAIFWFFYSLSVSRFFAEYERIAFFTSIVVVIISGFGLWQLECYAKSKISESKYGVFKMVQASILLVFLFFIPFYTQTNNWKSIIGINPQNLSKAYPKSPANNYLIADDLKIFEGIKNKRFLSIPWKGTVIGVATGNYPILTKQGTISIGSQQTLNQFMGFNCASKLGLAKMHKLDYVYIYKFDCPGFSDLGESSEGLVLYKID